MAAKGADSDAQTLASIIQQARKRDMNIALVMGKDGLSVAADPRKAPEVMWREAKKAGGGSKGGMGVCSVSGKEFRVQFVNDDFPTTLLKALKQKLRDEGQKFKPVLIGPDGSQTADEDETEDDAAEDEAVAAAGDAPAPEAEAAAGDLPESDAAGDSPLRAEFEELSEAITAAVATGTGPGKKVAALATMFTATLDKDEKKAKAVLDMLKTTLASVPAPAAAGGGGAAAQTRISGLADLEAQVDALLAEFA